uniref:Uncharacterized protein n=1 Tax=Bracon brevicornis TaxID=1563983 RepID=A0A6V7LZG8_9HYME
MMFAKSTSDEESTKDYCCMCSDITENLRINIREKTEVTSSSSPRSISPEVTHTIRIAMKYLGQPERIDEEETINDTPKQINCENSKEFNDCGVNVALDFTLNCCNIALTSREVTLKSSEKQRKNSE